MEDNKLLAMLREYHADGKDTGALLEDYCAMLANGKTPLGLNKWKHSDKPRMEDFNADNRIIDEKLREFAEDKAVIDTALSNVYTKDETDEALAKKANVNINFTWHELPIIGGAQAENVFKLRYTKIREITFLTGAIEIPETIGHNTVVATIPIGFRPDTSHLFLCPVSVNSTNTPYFAIFALGQNGELNFVSTNAPRTTKYGFTISCSFPTRD